MAKKKRNRVKPTRQNAHTPPARQTANTPPACDRREHTVRISQCMIVKNEEHNIRKALSWGRGIVCEQIVVDTGSTDRTVEIAEDMGAKVLHFEWVNDFAAAKNYAIGQATGDWIAFLDADEYFPNEDAAKLLPILTQMMTDPRLRGRYSVIACPMHQLDDSGKTMDVDVQARLFLNTPEIRYIGRIHEELGVRGEDITRTEDIKIMHTGYSESAYVQGNKSARNIGMLREELAKDPDNLRMKLYMAESLISRSNEITAAEERNPGEVQKYIDEAVSFYKEVVYGDTSAIDPGYKKTAYVYLLRKYSKTAGKDPEMDKITEMALDDFPEDHKIMCLYAAVQNSKGEYDRAMEVLRRCEALQNDPARRTFGYSMTDMVTMSTQMVYAAQGLGDIESVLMYTSAILGADKTNVNILGNYIKLLYRQLKSYENVLEILSMTYDLRNADDVAIIAAAARGCGAEALAQLAAGVTQLKIDN